jgi:carbon monoxide dehydrogenase subunit G
MADYTRTVTVAAAPDAAFAALADPKNLPRYVATMVAAEPEQGEQLHVAADVQGRHEEGDARFHADPDARRMEWSGAPGGDYNGWLEVAPAGEGSSVTVQIHVVHDADEAEINRVLDATAANIERLLGTESQ